MTFINIEIERKFIVNKELWQKVKKPAGILIMQGYLSTNIHKTIRVRVTGNKGYVTIKGKTINNLREEYEFKIPVATASELIENFAESIIEKLRYKIRYHGKTWEVDEFKGKNSGLLMAEIGLIEEHKCIELPDWIDIEVSDDERYFNSNLSKNPYENWGK